MTTRKTFSLPDELAKALEREASGQGKPESALVREGMQQYLDSLSTSKLSAWIGKGKSGKRVEHERIDKDLVEILERKHHPARRRGR